MSEDKDYIQNAIKQVMTVKEEENGKTIWDYIFAKKRVGEIKISDPFDDPWLDMTIKQYRETI